MTPLRTRPQPQETGDRSEAAALISPMDRRGQRPPRGRRLLLFGCGAALLLVACIALCARYAGTTSVSVRAASVVIAPGRQAVFTEYVPAAGVVAPRTTAYLDAIEGGQVAEVLVEEGAFVTRGQVLLKLKN